MHRLVVIVSHSGGLIRCNQKQYSASYEVTQLNTHFGLESCVWTTGTLSAYFLYPEGKGGL
jgi:hypothetical protein